MSKGYDHPAQQGSYLGGPTHLSTAVRPTKDRPNTQLEDLRDQFSELLPSLSRWIESVDIVIARLEGESPDKDPPPPAKTVLRPGVIGEINDIGHALATRINVLGAKIERLSSIV